MRLLKFTNLDMSEVEVEAWPGGVQEWLSREGGHSAQEEGEGPIETVLQSTGDTGGEENRGKGGSGKQGCPQTTEIFLCFRHLSLHNWR
ncbi:hypothetical protein ACOMHN_037529 [Nucella lapillus]